MKQKNRKNKFNLTKTQKKKLKINLKMAKLTYKQIPIGGMIEKAGSSLDFKTGDWKVFKPCWDEKKCTHCMFCVVYCPDNCIPVEKMELKTNSPQNETNNTKRKETNFDYCKGCGICAKVCPVKCIKMEEDKE